MSTKHSKKAHRINSADVIFNQIDTSAARNNQDSRSLRESLAAQARAKGESLISKARQAEEEMKDVPVWDQLNQAYIGARQALEIYGSVGLYSKRTDIHAAWTPQERATFVTSAKIFTEDLRKYSEDLNTIQALHAGRTGGLFVNGEPDLEQVKTSVQLMDQYDNFSQQARSVLERNYLHMMDLIRVAEERIATSGLKPEQDPKIVTDVVFNESSKTPVKQA